MYRKKLGYFCVVCIIFCSGNAFAYPWPVSIITQQHKISGTLGEYRARGGGSLHAGVDIAESGVHFYAVANGTIREICNTCRIPYVKIDNFDYAHVQVDTNRWRVGASVTVGDLLGTISGTHLHLEESDGALNPLRAEGLTPFRDTVAPVVNSVLIEEIGTPALYSIKADANDFRVCADGGNCGGATAPYAIGYEILNPAGCQIALVNPRWQFDSALYDVNEVYASGSTDSNFIYNLGEWNAAGLPEGSYSVRVMTRDIQATYKSAGGRELFREAKL